MKRVITIFTLISFFQFIPIIAMEQDDTMAENQLATESTIAGLSNEIWTMIFYSVYFDKAFNNCKDIFEALNYLKTDFKEKLSLYSKSISRTCKLFDCVNKNLQSIQKLKEFYRLLLSENFLELRDGGLYPKGGRWGIGYDFDKQTAKFLVTANGDDSPLVRERINCGFQYLMNCRYATNNEGPNLLKRVVSLLLFYGAEDFIEKTCMKYKL